MTVKDNENTIPKIYTYTVDGFYTEHENEENEKEFSNKQNILCEIRETTEE